VGHGGCTTALPCVARDTGCPPRRPQQGRPVKPLEPALRNGVDRSRSSSPGSCHIGPGNDDVNNGRILTMVRSPGPGPPGERLNRSSTAEPRPSGLGLGNRQSPSGPAATAGRVDGGGSGRPAGRATSGGGPVRGCARPDRSGLDGRERAVVDRAASTRPGVAGVVCAQRSTGSGPSNSAVSLLRPPEVALRHTEGTACA
jgi:hypothetical protein